MQIRKVIEKVLREERDGVSVDARLHAVVAANVEGSTPRGPERPVPGPQRKEDEHD